MTPLKPKLAQGCKRGLPDYRDFKLSLFEAAPVALPAAVDLRPECPPVYDQLNLGSCSSNAVSLMFRFVDRKDLLADFNPSRLALYYEARAMEGDQSLDNGSVIRDNIQVAVNAGLSPEADWPYDTSKVFTPPSQAALSDAKAHEATAYLSVGINLDEMKGCLAAGYPFVIGLVTYENFQSTETLNTGDVQMPVGAQTAGHAVCVVGYDDALQRLRFRNSWGTRFGAQGDFTLPYAYATDGSLAFDVWTIRQVTGLSPIPPPPPPPPPVPVEFDGVLGKVKPNGAIQLWPTTPVIVPPGTKVHVKEIA